MQKHFEVKATFVFRLVGGKEPVATITTVRSMSAIEPKISRVRAISFVIESVLRKFIADITVAIKITKCNLESCEGLSGRLQHGDSLTFNADCAFQLCDGGT